jgi:hypothetical protein
VLCVGRADEGDVDLRVGEHLVAIPGWRAPCFSANAAARPASRLTTATNSLLGSLAMAGAIQLSATLPGPMMPHPIVIWFSFEFPAAGLQYVSQGLAGWQTMRRLPSHFGRGALIW